MDEIIQLRFMKSKSANYTTAVKVIKSLPNYTLSETEEHICHITTIKEMIIHYQAILQLISLIEKWKGSTIYYYGNEHKDWNDFWLFKSRLISEAGKYAEFFNNSECAMDTISLEELPLPVVYYPNHYGAFFAFSEDIDNPIFFCSCEEKAIKNYIRLRKRHPLNDYTGLKTAPLGNDFFPKRISEISLLTPEKPLEHFQFKENLCFRCNKKIPRYKYCVPMYGTKFQQNYGWYIKQKFFELGIDPYQLSSGNILIGECPAEIYDNINRYTKFVSKRVKDSLSEELEHQISQYGKAISDSVENLAREDLGFKRIGEAWLSETILFHIVEAIFPTYTVKMHYRPTWLNGLELDIYVHELNIAFEYQGIQHFEPIDYFGGKAQLRKQQEHDCRKKELCQKQEVTLITVNYDEELSEALVKSKLAECSIFI